MLYNGREASGGFLSVPKVVGHLAVGTPAVLEIWKSLEESTSRSGRDRLGRVAFYNGDFKNPLTYLSVNSFTV